MQKRQKSLVPCSFLHGTRLFYADGNGFENWIEPTGVKVLCFWGSGFRHFTNNVRPIYTPEDMAGIKFRSAEPEIRVKMFEVLGASATIINFSELYTALQQGTVDGQENPLSIIAANGFYDVQKYLSLSGHFYSAALFIVNPNFWNSLPAEYQEIIQTASEECRDYDRQLSTEPEEEMIQTCKDNGMEVNEIDKEAFKEAMDEFWALLSAYMLWGDGESLEDYLDIRIFSGSEPPEYMAGAEEIQGFERFEKRYLEALPMQQTAWKYLRD